MIKSAKKPVVTAIGNHDYVSNGYTVYKRIFGANNFAFTYGKYKFILFDNVVWENGNHPLNFEWLRGELENNSKYNVFISHLPFWDPQIDSSNNKKFKETLRPNNTMLCLHGHTHNYKECEQFGIHTLVAGDLKDREYFVITLANAHFKIERVKY